MNSLVNQIEKLTPFFEKISRNKFLRAVKDGFIAAMPVILFSSIFMLVAYVPNIWGFYWSETIERLIVTPYNFTMGILAPLVAGTTAKSLTDSYNRDLEATNQINNVSTMLAAISGLFILAVDQIEGGFASGYLGTTGLLAAFVSAFIVVIVYNFFISRDITIKMPDEVPGNIAQTFKDVIPFSAAILIIYTISLIVRNFSGANFAQTVIELFQPFFSYADGYLGLALIYGAMAFFWFIGIHGPSIVEPAISAIAFLNLDLNLELFQAGEQATNIVTPGLQYFVATLGGTGATFIVPFMFMLIGRSKQNKAVGRASVIPTSFGVNEPILFGGPLVLNPVFFVPFIAAPIANVWLFKFFVDVLGMNGFMYFLPWTTPGPIGLAAGTGFAFWAIVLAVVLLVVDWIIYYPFFRVYDNQILAQEAEKDETEAVEISEPTVATQTAGAAEVSVTRVETPTTAPIAANDEIGHKDVFVICAGGGTSGILANSLNKAAKEYDADISAAAGTYGAHSDMLPNYDMVILAPQVASNYEDIKKETDKHGIKLVKTEGQQYIQLTRDPEGSLKFVLDQFTNN